MLKYGDFRIKVLVNKAITLVELIIIIGILAILAGYALPELSRFITDSKIAKAKADVKMLAQQVTKFEAEQNNANKPSGNIINKQITEIRRDATSAEINLKNVDIEGGIQVLNNDRTPVRLKNLRELKGKYITNIDELKDPWWHDYKIIPAAGKTSFLEDIYNNELIEFSGNLVKNFKNLQGSIIEIEIKNNEIIEKTGETSRVLFRDKKQHPVIFFNQTAKDELPTYLYAEIDDSESVQIGSMKINQYISDSEPVIIYSMGLNGLDDRAKKDDIKQKCRPLKWLDKTRTVKKILPQN